MSFTAFTKRMAADAGRIRWQPEHYSMLAKHYNVSEEQVAKAIVPTAPVVTYIPETITKSGQAAHADVQRSYKWIMNDGELDRSNDIVVASGVDLTHFKSNNIALLQHDPSKPIGTWTGVRAEGGKLKGTLNLAPTRLGEYVRENINAGVLKAASIGFLPIEFTPIKGGGFRFEKIECMECSVVSIPASRGSLRERDLTPEERKEQARELVARIKADDAKWEARSAVRAVEPRPQSPEVISAEAKLATARAMRAERESVSKMSVAEHTQHLNQKLARKERRRLAELRGRS